MEQKRSGAKRRCVRNRQGGYDRQRLLEERHPLRRLRIACRLLTREAGFLNTLGAVPVPPGELTDLSRPSSMN